MALLLVAQPASGQARLEARVGLAAATTLVREAGGLAGDRVAAWARTSPVMEAGVRLPVRPDAELAVLIGWQPTQLRVREAWGTRDAGDLALVHGVVELNLARSGRWRLAGGLGALAYRGEAGLFEDGADLTALGRVAAGVAWPVGGHQVTVRAVGDVHRFGTARLRELGGSTGNVVRYGVAVGIVW